MTKNYSDNLVKECEKVAERLTPQEVIAYIEGKTSGYDSVPSDIYILLAKAKEATNALQSEIITTYKKSLANPRKPSKYVPEAISWLSDKIPQNEYVNVVKECVSNSDDPYYNLYNIARFFQLKGNWKVFQCILDTTLSEENVILLSQAVDRGLEKNEIWAKKFNEYCRGRSECTRYLFYKQEIAAKKEIHQKNFAKAAEIYRDIIRQCSPSRQKLIYELIYYECLLNEGKNIHIVEDLEDFIRTNKCGYRALTVKAMLLKGQAYVHLGKLDQAIDIFLRLIIEYPERAQAPQASFFLGYCNMLQGNFKEATEAFNLVVKNYPESSYSNQASTYISRIKSMTN